MAGQVDFECIPHGLQLLPRWMLWTYRRQGDATQKVPIDGHTFRVASVTDPHSWMSFDDIQSVWGTCNGYANGLNFCLSADDHLIGIDLDDCRDTSTGTITEDAQAIITALQSYTEITPSGTGIRIFVRGVIPTNRRRGTVEIYHTGKSLSVTGRHLPGTSTDIEDRSAEISAWYAAYFGVPEIQPERPIEKDIIGYPGPDDEIIRLASEGLTGEKFADLWTGQWETFYASQSEADLALCSLLAWWTGPNVERLDQLFRQSALFRPKWDHKRGQKTYGALTIEKVLSTLSSWYDGIGIREIPQGEETVEEPQSFDWETGTEQPFESKAEPQPKIEPDEEPADPQEAPEEPLSVEAYPCPDILWQGIFAEVAERIGKRSWEVFVGTFGALSARAHRNLHCFYFNDHIYGNSFSLLINPTGAGKNMVVNVARSLLGEMYKIRTGLNSGPALIPLLTDDCLKSPDGRLELQGVPVLLLCAEWSRIAQMSGIEHSTLQEDLNEMFMRHYSYSQSRSHRSPTGGDVVIHNTALTIIGTTTRTLFAEAATDRALGNGTINRYLILPGNAEFEPYVGKSYRVDEHLPGLIDHLQTHLFGLGQEIGDLYTRSAFKQFLEFQDSFIMPLRKDPFKAQVLGRLHLHTQHIAALYAWQMQSPQITEEHFAAATTLAQISHDFVMDLLEERKTSFEPSKKQTADAAMEQRVLSVVKKTPKMTKREAINRLVNTKAGYAAWAAVIDGLIKLGHLVVTMNGKRAELLAQ